MVSKTAIIGGKKNRYFDIKNRVLSKKGIELGYLVLFYLAAKN
jgi:hypothetical protein